MADSPLALAILSPDIIPEITSSLPLCIEPSTLLALALTNRRLKEIVIPHLLYRRIWLQGEDRTLTVLDKLKTQPVITEQENAVLGSIVQRLSIASELSTAARGREMSVIHELRRLLEVGALQNLISLALHLSFGRLDRSFWDSLKIGCPRLTEFSLSGVHENDDEPWLEQSGLFDFQNLTVFRFQVSRYPYHSFAPLLHRLLDSLAVASPRLHTLSLHFIHGEEDVTADGGLLTRHFPHLRSLTLCDFTVERPEVATNFWSQHPTLEVIELSRVNGSWFETSLTGLPNLRVLKAPFDDACVLLPLIGHQLSNVTISTSINAQVPYLLRTLLPNGLPTLRSLGIYQRASNNSREINQPGSRWREDEQGVISEASKKKASTHIDAAYVLSVLRGAPNVEELELCGELQLPIASIAFAMSTSPKLTRLFYSRRSHGAHRASISSGSLLDHANEFAQHCQTLESVTSIDGIYQTVHTRARIHRKPDDTFYITREPGVGRTIGLEDSDHPDIFA